MAVQDAWGLEADVRTCTADPSEPLRNSNSSDRWIECDVASRWSKLSLEITERWRFELRGARLIDWEPVIAELDPPARALPLGYPGLEAWEAWLETNHPEDADRWLVARQEPAAADLGDVADPEQAAALARLTLQVDQEWVIQGHRFSPAGLIPYDPAFADAIEASIHDYLEER
jgi:hypothetical protein